MATQDPNVSPEASQLGDRLFALQQNGHGWMDPTLQVGLAQNGGSVPNMLGTAQTYANVLNNTPNTISNKYTDPVLNTKPGPATTALATVANTHGPIPFKPQNITDIQKNLQNAGFGNGLSVGDAWNPAWQSAFTQHNYAQLTKPGLGNTDSFNLFKSVLNTLIPAGWAATDIHAISSFVHGMANPIRQMVADVVGSTIADFGVGTASTPEANHQQAIGRIENDLGAKLTPDQISKIDTTRRSIEDIGNLFTLVMLKGTGGSLFKAAGTIGGGLAEGAGAEAATSTLGNIAAGAKAVAQNPSLLLTKSLPEEFANAPKLTMVKSLANAATNSANGVGVFSKFTSPIASRVAPALESLASEDGKYFAGKQAIASLMRNPLRSGVSALQTRGSLLGLGLLGSSELQDKLGAQPTFDATKVTPYQGILGNALNLISLGAGSTAAPLKMSNTVGNLVSSAHEGITNALGPIGFDSIVRRGLGIKLKDLQQGVGEDFVNDHFIKTKLPQYAASHAAQQAADLDVWSGKIDRNSEEYQSLVQGYENEILNDPDMRGAAVESLVNNPTQWAQMMRNDFVRQFGSLVRKNGVAKKDQQAFFNSLNELKNGPYEFMQPIVNPNIRNFVHGSSTVRTVEDMASSELSNKFGQDVPQYYSGNLPAGQTSPRLVALHRGVNDFAPNGADLARTTKYGKGIVATEDSGIAGRANANAYALRHADQTEQPNFLNLTKNNSTKELAAKIKDFATNEEMNVKRGDVTPEYKALTKALNNPSDTTGQKLLDAYRAALRAGNKLNTDQIDQRMDQLTNQFMIENKITGMKYVDPTYGPQTLVRPDKVIANLVKTGPDANKDQLLSSYLTHNNVNGLGTIGAARKDTLLAQDAIAEAKKVFSQLKKAGYGADADAARSTLELEAISKQRGLTMDTTPLPTMANVSEDPKLIKIVDEARKVLVTKFDKSYNDLSRLDPVQLASLMWRESRLRASEAYLPAIKPAGVSEAEWNAAKNAFAEADRKGYRVALGTDIGHGYEKPTIPNYIVNQRTSLLRKSAMRLGIDTTRINDLSVANARRNNVVDEVNKVLGKDITPILGDTGETIYSRLLQGAQSSLFDTSKVKSGSKALKNLEKLGVDSGSKTYQDLEEEINTARNKEAEINRDAHQIRDLSLKQMVKILQRKADPADITGNPIPGYSQEDAQKIARAVLVGYAKTPASLVGISKVEDFVRASGAMLANQTASFMGEAPLLKNFKIGDGPLINTLASLPNDLFRLRDKWRFDLNPVFSARRLAKTNVKAAIEGVPPSMNPYNTLNRMGAVNDAMNVLNRTMPNVYKAQKDLEPLEKMLVQNDRWNIYNPGHNMMWQAYNLEKLGKSDSEITAALNKINTYGDRTPLERTVNTIFYPFSFNKTLYRNIGGYLLDNPGHTFLIDAGFNLYSHYNKNNAIGAWIDNHMPLLVELQKLNAFEHGTGLGQFGGINAPYLSPLMNLFSPQRIQPGQAQDAISTITNLVPALSELNKILFDYQPSTGKADFKGTAVETAKVGFWAAKNLEEHAKTLFSHQKRIAYQPMMTDQAQTKAGQQTVTMLKTQLASLMNTSNVWPNDPSVPSAIRGKKYDASSFGQFAHALYPSYDPTLGTSLALEKNQKALDYVASLEGTSRYDLYNQFQKIATSAIQKLHKTNDPSAIQSIVDPLRQAATYMAESDGKFLTFYNKFYESSLGPIEGLSK